MNYGSYIKREAVYKCTNKEFSQVVINVLKYKCQIESKLLQFLVVFNNPV